MARKLRIQYSGAIYQVVNQAGAATERLRVEQLSAISGDAVAPTALVAGGPAVGGVMPPQRQRSGGAGVGGADGMAAGRGRAGGVQAGGTGLVTGRAAVSAGTAGAGGDAVWAEALRGGGAGSRSGAGGAVGGGAAGANGVAGDQSQGPPQGRPAEGRTGLGITVADGTWQFGFTNTPGASFTVLATTNPVLPASDWIVRGSPTEISPGHFQFTDPQATHAPLFFYRVRSR